MISRRAIGLTMLGLSLCVSSFADEVNIPLRVKENCFKRAMLEKGYDLSGLDEADGEAGYKSGMFNVNIYRQVEISELEIIKECAFECVRK